MKLERLDEGSEHKGVRRLLADVLSAVLLGRADGAPATFTHAAAALVTDKRADIVGAAADADALKGAGAAVLSEVVAACHLGAVLRENPAAALRPTACPREFAYLSKELLPAELGGGRGAAAASGAAAAAAGGGGGAASGGAGASASGGGGGGGSGGGRGVVKPVRERTVGAPLPVRTKGVPSSKGPGRDPGRG
jgi:hypothetical protein